MKRIAIVLLPASLLFVLLGCHIGGVHGSGVRKTEKRDLPSFTAIETTGAFDVQVTCQKPSPRVGAAVRRTYSARGQTTRAQSDSGVAVARRVGFPSTAATPRQSSNRLVVRLRVGTWISGQYAVGSE